MTTEPGDIESVLAVDIGSVNTRAILFDLVGSSYRMLSAGNVPSTHLPPIGDVQEGVIAAVHQVEEITGKTLLDSNHHLIIPASPEGAGVDNLVISSSAGVEVRIVTIGLLDEYSLAQVETLVGGSYARVVDRFTLGDKRKPEQRLNAFLDSNPDLVLMAGGTNRGATRAVLRMADQLRLALQASNPEKRPEVIFAGNAMLKDRIKEMLENLTSVYQASNVLPFAESVDTGAAEETLIQVLNHIRAKRLNGFSDLERISGVSILPSASAEGRVVRFQSLQQSSEKTVLGINVGSAASHFITATAGDIKTNVFRGLGIGHAAVETLTRLGVEAILPWLSIDIPQGNVRDYLWQKSLFPAGLPMDEETLEIEQAAARVVLAEMKRSYFGLPNAFLQGFEPILVSGAVLAQAPTLQQTLLMVLDGLQPAGATTILCDRFGVLSALGACAPISPPLVVQVLETGVLTNLGTVLCPIGRARVGEVILRIKLQEEDGLEKSFEVRKGEIVRLPLGLNKTARLSIKALKHLDGFQGLRNLKVVGGELGVIVDARSRPIRHPSDEGMNHDLMKKWKDSLKECLT